MSPQTQKDPTRNRSVPLTSYTFSQTGPSGTITMSGTSNVSTVQTGDSLIVSLTTPGATSGGYTHLGEYFTINGSSASGSLQVATTKANALAGTPDLTASGANGSGTLYMNSPVGGRLYVGTSGNLFMKGVGEGSSFVMHNAAPAGTVVPLMIGLVSASGTTASNLVAWDD